MVVRGIAQPYSRITTTVHAAEQQEPIIYANPPPGYGATAPVYGATAPGFGAPVPGYGGAVPYQYPQTSQFANAPPAYQPQETKIPTAP